MAEQKGNAALDGESRTGEVIAILSVASASSTLAVTLRCYCRHTLLRHFGWDDAIMVFAQILTIASAVAIGLETQWGLGRHVWTMPPEHFTPYMKAFYSSIITYNVAVTLTKISIVLQYRRLFFQSILRHITLGILLALGTWGLTLSIMLPLVCTPVASFWDPSVPGRCMNFETVWYVMAGVNVATDFILFILPIPVISSLHLPRRQKLLLIVVFGLGLFPCAISIYRIRTLHAAAVSADPTWDNVGAATFSFLELTIGVVAVCLPTLRPLLAMGMPRLFESLRSSRRNQGPFSETARPEESMSAPRRMARLSVSTGNDSTLRGSGVEDSTEEMGSRGELTGEGKGNATEIDPERGEGVLEQEKKGQEP